jgi:type IV pilus assembly protein PilN
MIRINLLPVKELEAESVRRRELIIGGTVFGIAILLLCGVYLFQWREHSRLQNELTGLRNEIQALNVKVKEVGDLQNKIKDLRGKNKIFEDLSKKRVGPVRVLESLSVATPTSLWLTELRENGGNLVINGLAMDNQIIAEFMRALTNSKYFANVDLVEVIQEKSAAPALKKFSIKSALLYQPAEPKPVGAPVKAAAAPTSK